MIELVAGLLKISEAVRLLLVGEQFTPSPHHHHRELRIIHPVAKSIMLQYQQRLTQEGTEDQGAGDTRARQGNKWTTTAEFQT